MVEKAHIAALTIELHRLDRGFDLRQRLADGGRAGSRVRLAIRGEVPFRGCEQREEKVVATWPEMQAAAAAGAVVKQDHRAELVPT